MSLRPSMRPVSCPAMRPRHTSRKNLLHASQNRISPAPSWRMELQAPRIAPDPVPATGIDPAPLSAAAPPIRACWTPARQRIFLAMLLDTGSVARAARAAHVALQRAPAAPAPGRHAVRSHLGSGGHRARTPPDRSVRARGARSAAARRAPSHGRFAGAPVMRPSREAVASLSPGRRVPVAQVSHGCGVGVASQARGCRLGVAWVSHPWRFAGASRARRPQKTRFRSISSTERPPRAPSRKGTGGATGAPPQPLEHA